MYQRLKDQLASRDSRATLWLGAMLLALAVLVVYVPVYQAGFIWDDDEVLTANPYIQSPEGWRAIWFSTQFHDYFPLTYSSFWLEWQLWGMNATGYHVTNVLLHALGTVLLWRVLVRLGIPGAWLAALIFGVHPVCVASVAWISERKNTLSLVFYLLSILWYLRSDSESSTKSGAKRKWYVLSLFAFLLALLSKTSVVTLPIVLWLCVWWQRTQRSPQSGVQTTDARAIAHAFARQDFVRLIPFFALAFILGLVTVWFQLYQPRGSDVGYRSDNLWVRLIAGSWAVWFYLGKILLPAQLSMIYPRWDVNPATVVSYLPGLLWLGGLYWCWRRRRSWGRAPFFGLGYFWVVLWPVLGVFDMRFLSHTRVADHWQYLALIGVIALVVGAVVKQVCGWETGRTGMSASSDASHQPALSLFHARFFIPAAVVVLLLSILTWRQVGLYAHPEQLWLQALKRNPRSPSPWISMGLVLDSQGRFTEAEHYYREALRRRSDIPVAHNNLGYVLLNQRKLDEAAPYFLKALQLKPDFAEAHYNLGMVHFLQGKTDDAVKNLREAVRLKPHLAGAHNQLGIALAGRGEFDPASSHFALALQYGFDPAKVHTNLGKSRLAQGRIDAAVRHFREALRLQPQTPDALNNLAWILATHPQAQYRNGTEAVNLAERAAWLTKQEDAGALDTLAAAYAEANRFSEAVQTAQRALGLAQASAQTNLVADIQKRLALYESGQPYRE